MSDRAFAKELVDTSRIRVVNRLRLILGNRLHAGMHDATELEMPCRLGLCDDVGASHKTRLHNPPLCLVK